MLASMLSKCAEVAPRCTLVPLAVEGCGEAAAGLAARACACPSPAGVTGKGLVDFSIFTAITFSVRLAFYIVNPA